MTQDLSADLPPLPWLRAFEASARHLNFTAAAAEIGLTQAAVSQQIRLLEARLGARLFQRQRRGVVLTADGGAFLPHVQSAFAGLAHATAELFGPRPALAVELLSPVSFASLWLAPRLAPFGRELPGLELTIRTVHLPADYQGPAADFDIRFGTGEWRGRTAHRLTAERLTPVCAPALVPAAVADPAWWHGLPRLAVSGAREGWPDWFALAGSGPPKAPTLRFDTFVAAALAAEAGAGVLLGSRPLIDPALTTGRLIRLSELERRSLAGHFITHESGAVLTAAQRAVLLWFQRQAG